MKNFFNIIKEFTSQFVKFFKNRKNKETYLEIIIQVCLVVVIVSFDILEVFGKYPYDIPDKIPFWAIFIVFLSKSLLLTYNIVRPLWNIKSVYSLKINKNSDEQLVIKVYIFINMLRIFIAISLFIYVLFFVELNFIYLKAYLKLLKIQHNSIKAQKRTIDLFRKKIYRKP